MSAFGWFEGVNNLDNSPTPTQLDDLQDEASRSESFLDRHALKGVLLSMNCLL
jgi:hypothetical protein